MTWLLRYKEWLLAKGLFLDRFGKLAGLIPQCGEVEAGYVQSSQ